MAQLLRVAFPLALLVCAACGTKVSYLQTNAAPRHLTPRAPAQVEVYMTSLPERPYAEVGLISVEGRNGTIDTNDLVRAMRNRAAKEGCDAVVLGGASNKVVGSAHHNPDGSGHANVTTLKGREGVCIVYSDLAPSRQSASQRR